MQTAITGLFKHPMNDQRKYKFNKSSMQIVPTIPQTNKLPQLDPDKIFKKNLPTTFLEKVKILCKDNKFGTDILTKFFKRIH